MNKNIIILTITIILTNLLTFGSTFYYYDTELSTLKKELQDSVKITKLDIGEFIIKGNKMYEVTLMRKETVYR